MEGTLYPASHLPSQHSEKGGGATCLLLMRKPRLIQAICDKDSLLGQTLDRHLPAWLDPILGHALKSGFSKNPARTVKPESAVLHV